MPSEIDAPCRAGRSNLSTVVLMGGLLLPCVALAGEPIPADQWQEFESKDQKFKLFLPGKPKAQRQPIPGTNQEMVMHIVDLGRKAFLVSSVEVPAERWQTVPLETLLDDSRDGMLRNSPGSKVVSESKIKHEGYPGREVVINVPERVKWSYAWLPPDQGSIWF